MNVREISLTPLEMGWEEGQEAARALLHSICFIRATKATKTQSAVSRLLEDLKYPFCKEAESQIDAIVESMRPYNQTLCVSFFVKTISGNLFFPNLSSGGGRGGTSTFEKWFISMKVDDADATSPNAEVERALAEVFQHANKTDHMPLSDYEFNITIVSNSKPAESKEWGRRSNSTSSTGQGRQFLLKTLNSAGI